LGKLLGVDVKLNEMSPLTLAFIGDGVYELFVREYIVGLANCSANKLHKKCVEMVRCEAQAASARKLLEFFTEAETDVYMRGRNAHVSHVPKNSKIGDYHAATALEAVFGYLYLNGKIDRLRELFEMIIKE